MAEAAAPTTYSMLAVTLTLLLYCVSGTLLTLVNKLAIVAFPHANVLLIIQNGVTVVLLLLGSWVLPGTFQAMPRLTWQVIKLWSPLVVLFVLMLSSSLNALTYVSAVTLIVMRNLSTLCVAFFEWIWLGEEILLMTWLALVGILAGAIVFGARDMMFSVPGYLWLAVNVLSTSTYQVYVKKLIKESKELGPFGMSYINNMLSLPVFVAMAFGTRQLPEAALSLPEQAVDVQVWIGLSALLGFVLSTSAFMINKMITATSMMVANNVNKFAVILLSELFIQRTLDNVSMLGTVLVMFFGWFYSQTKTMKPLAWPWTQKAAAIPVATVVAAPAVPESGDAEEQQALKQDEKH